MPLWGKKNQSNNAPVFVTDQLQVGSGNANKTANARSLFTNLVPNSYVNNEVDSVIFVSSDAIANGSISPGSGPGWYIKRTGSGGRAGRVSYELLVAGSNQWGATSFQPTYYVDNVLGNDTFDGRSASRPWKTVAKVNGTSLNPGDVVAFRGGQVFGNTTTGGNTIIIPTSGNSAAPIVFTSYGTGRATIQANVTLDAFQCFDKSYISVYNLNFNGAGGGIANNSSGMYFSANTANVTGIAVSQIFITNFTSGGLWFGGDGVGKGFSNCSAEAILISNCNGTALGSYGSGGTGTFTNQNIRVRNVRTLNNGGSGIYLGNVKDSIIEGCFANNNGFNTSSGPVGIWIYDAQNTVIQYCESAYSNTSGSDADGFDIDGGSKDCIIQYCYSHNNRGAGYLMWNYAAGAPYVNNTIRYCISENDGNNTFYGALTIGRTAGSNAMSNCFVYNNTFYLSGNGISANVKSVITITDNTVAGKIMNNIIYANSTAKLANVVGPTPAIQFIGNNWYTPNTFIIVWNGVTYNSYAAWQTATNQEKIAGNNVGLNVNPLLVSPGSGGFVNNIPSALTSYQLQANSPMINAGLNVQAQTGLSYHPGLQDYYNAPIPQSFGFDIGAHDKQ